MNLNEEFERKNREDERHWKRTLTQYMMWQFGSGKERAEAMLPNVFNLAAAMAPNLRERSVLSVMREKKRDEPSALELLEKICEQETPDSPMMELLQSLKKENPSEEEIARALSLVMLKEPPRMLDAARREREQRTTRYLSCGELADDFEAVEIDEARFNELYQRKLTLLRMIMPPKLFKTMEEQLTLSDRLMDMERDKQAARARNKELELRKQKELDERQKQETSKYEKYVEEKRLNAKAEMEKKTGELAKSNDVFAAAAYMIAAYEQKDEKDFDPEKADARAEEISDSRAFRVYMKGHPKNLAAAAKNSHVEAVRNDIQELDGDLEHRDAVLADARDNLKNMKSGKTQCFHQMLGALDRFVNADTEPSQQEKTSLLTALGTYITTDCAPKSREADTACFTQAMRSVKVLVPEKEFDAFLDVVNEGRAPKAKSVDFDLEISPKQRAAEKQLTAEIDEPLLVLKRESDDE